MNDDAIVELYWQRDESALAVTQEKYNAYLMKIARNILNNSEDSEESVNDTYLAAWNSMPPQKPVVLSTYLGKLTRRISISLFRKRAETYPGRTGVYWIFKLSDGSIEDIPGDVLTQLAELGWKTAADNKN